MVMLYAFLCITIQVTVFQSSSSGRKLQVVLTQVTYHILLGTGSLNFFGCTVVSLRLTILSCLTTKDHTIIKHVQFLSREHWPEYKEQVAVQQSGRKKQ